ncbi:MAG: amino acid ABC transporter substrate-binding protein [Chloroflexi bacterium]|nr:amino acid ABC transporter substrate-binding protein [Chloroflexota bacterium]
MNRKLFLMLALILVLSAISVACAPAPAPAATSAPAATQAPAATAAPTKAPKTLLVGFTESKTGAQNVASKKQVEGLNLWLDTVKKAGGIKLKDGTVYIPELKSYDDQSTADRVQQLYTQLITSDKVDFLISPYSSTLVKSAAIVSEQNSKVMLTVGGADDATMEQGFKNIYQLYTPGSRYLIGAVDAMLKLDPTIKRVAVVNEKDSFSVSVVAGLLPYLKEKGLEVVVNEGYDTGTTDFSPFINKISAATPDAILGGGHLPDGTTFAKQLKEKNVAVRFVSLLVAPPEPTFADIGDAALGIVGPSQWEAQVTYSPEAAKTANLPFYGPINKDFIAAYLAKYNAPPSYHSAGGYAGGLLLQKVIEDADSIDPEKIKAALDKTNVMTFYGVVQFSTDAKSHGKQVAHTMVYMQWQKDAAGKLVAQVVWPLTAKSADAILRK